MSSPSLWTRLSARYHDAFGRVSRVGFSRQAKDIDSAITPPSDANFRALTDDDFLRFPVFVEKNRAAHYQGWRAAGYRCYGYFTKSDELMSYIWFAAPQDTALLLPAPLKCALWIQPKTAYLWDCRTLDAFQRQGLYASGLRQCCALAAKEGALSFHIECDPDNSASGKGIEKAGFSIDYEYKITKAFHYRWVSGKNVPFGITNREGVALTFLHNTTHP